MSDICPGCRKYPSGKSVRDHHSGEVWHRDCFYEAAAEWREQAEQAATSLDLARHVLGSINADALTDLDAGIARIKAGGTLAEELQP